MSSYLDRSISLIGEDAMKIIQSKTVLVIGLGGVGGTALEALARSGFKHFIVVDHDKVDPTNINRQVMYLNSDIGKNKTDVCVERIKDIASDVDVKSFDVFVDDSNMPMFDEFHIDYIVDAIDKVPSKLAIYKYAFARNIPVISSMGMGKRVDPTKVFVTSLNKTEGDPLARKIRYECKQLGISPSSIKAICSKEEPIESKDVIASMMMVPSSAGLLIASEIIKSYK